MPQAEQPKSSKAQTQTRRIKQIQHREHHKGSSGAPLGWSSSDCKHKQHVDNLKPVVVQKIVVCCPGYLVGKSTLQPFRPRPKARITRSTPNPRARIRGTIFGQAVWPSSFRGKLNGCREFSNLEGLRQRTDQDIGARKLCNKQKVET